MKKFLLVINDLKTDLIMLFLGSLWGLFIGILWVKMYGIPPAGTGILGTAAVMANVFIVAPFVSVFRSLAMIEWWQKYLLLRIPQFSFGVVLGLTLGSKGFDPVGLTVWALGVGLALSFFASSPQSRGYQGTQAQQTGLYGKCVKFGALCYQLNTLGRQDLVDAMLRQINPKGEQTLRDLIDQIRSDIFEELSDSAVMAVKDELHKFIYLEF